MLNVIIVKCHVAFCFFVIGVEDFLGGAWHASGYV